MRPGARQAAKPAERGALAQQAEALVAVAAAHADGKEAYARGIATELLEDFLAVEERFGAAREATEQEVIDSLRQVRRSVAPGQGLTQHNTPPLFPSDARPCASAFPPKLPTLSSLQSCSCKIRAHHSVHDRFHAISALR